MANSIETKSQETVTEDLIRLINNMESELGSFKATLEIPHDKELMESIKRSEEDLTSGRVADGMEVQDKLRKKTRGEWSGSNEIKKWRTKR